MSGGILEKAGHALAADIAWIATSVEGVSVDRLQLDAIRAKWRAMVPDLSEVAASVSESGRKSEAIEVLSVLRGFQSRSFLQWFAIKGMLGKDYLVSTDERFEQAIIRGVRDLLKGNSAEAEAAAEAMVELKSQFAGLKKHNHHDPSLDVQRMLTSKRQLFERARAKMSPENEIGSTFDARNVMIPGDVAVNGPLMPLLTADSLHGRVQHSVGALSIASSVDGNVAQVLGSTSLNAYNELWSVLDSAALSMVVSVIATYDTAGTVDWIRGTDVSQATDTGNAHFSHTGAAETIATAQASSQAITLTTPAGATTPSSVQTRSFGGTIKTTAFYHVEVPRGFNQSIGVTLPAATGAYVARVEVLKVRMLTEEALNIYTNDGVPVTAGTELRQLIGRIGEPLIAHLEGFDSVYKVLGILNAYEAWHDTGESGILDESRFHSVLDTWAKKVYNFTAGPSSQQMYDLGFWLSRGGNTFEPDPKPNAFRQLYSKFVGLIPTYLSMIEADVGFQERFAEDEGYRRRR